MMRMARHRMHRVLNRPNLGVLRDWHTAARADKAPGQLQLRRKPSGRPSLSSLHGAFEALGVEGGDGRGRDS